MKERASEKEAKKQSGRESRQECAAVAAPRYVRGSESELKAKSQGESDDDEDDDVRVHSEWVCRSVRYDQNRCQRRMDVRIQSESQ